MPGGKWTFKSFSYICISVPTISDDPDELDSFIMVLLIKSPIKSMSCGSVRFPAHYRVGERLELFLVPYIGRLCLLCSENELLRALLHHESRRDDLKL